MTIDRPRRPILSLKRAPAPPPSKATSWKCKPCGAVLVITGAEDPAADVRCPSCNARLGVAADFHAPETTSKIRARKVSTPPA